MGDICCMRTGVQNISKLVGPLLTALFRAKNNTKNSYKNWANGY